MRTLRRLWWVPVALALVLALAAVGMSRLQSESYSSTTRLIVTSQVSGESILSDSPNANTYADLATSGSVLDQVTLELGLDKSREDLSGMITVNPVPNTQIIVITVTADDPQLAADIANSVSRNLVTVADDLSIGELERNRDNLESQANRLRDEIVVYDTRIEQIEAEGNTDDPAVAAELDQIERDKLRANQTLADLDQSIRSINTELGSMLIPVAVTDFAIPAEESDAISPVLVAILGAFLGLLIGFAIILFAAVRDTVVRDPSQIVSHPLLQTVPVGDLGSGQSNSLTMLSSRLEVIAAAAGVETVAFASAGSIASGENLSAHVAEAAQGQGPTLVDANGVFSHPEAIRQLRTASGAVTVAHLGHTRTEELEELAEFLASIGIRDLGTVLIV